VAQNEGRLLSSAVPSNPSTKIILNTADCPAFHYAETNTRSLTGGRQRNQPKPGLFNKFAGGPDEIRLHLDIHFHANADLAQRNYLRWEVTTLLVRAPGKLFQERQRSQEHLCLPKAKPKVRIVLMD